MKVKEAKRFYAHFYLIANLATAFSGIVGRFYAKVGQHLPTEFERYGQTVHYTAWTVVLLGLLVMFLYNYLNSKVVTDPRLVTADEAMPEKKKLKLGVGESIKFIFQSKYLGLIAILVISYGITINLVEVAWKQEIHHLYPEKSHYNAYMNLVSTINGLTTFFVILIGGYLVRVMGWRAGALATPFALGITGVIFFYFMIFTDSVTPLAAILGTTALTLTVVFGTIQNVLSKSIKYALFDPTKEMSYIPLDPESKAKGKAAVDVVGGRLGKGGGAAIQQILFLITGLGTAGIAPYSASLLLIFTLIWIWAVFNLHKLFVAKGGEEVKPKA